MSFLGAIGKIMGGSGLEELWTTVYAKNSVNQMMEGRAYARSVRAHILTSLALHLEILKDSAVPVEWNAQLQELRSRMLADKMSVFDVSREPALSAFMDELTHTYLSAKGVSRTGEYWVQYMGLVDLLRLYLRLPMFIRRHKRARCQYLASSANCLDCMRQPHFPANIPTGICNNLLFHKTTYVYRIGGGL